MKAKLHGERTNDLPIEFLIQIGRLITVFSCIEDDVRQITNTLLRLTPQEGRIAVRSPRISDCFDMIESLLDLNAFSVTHDLKALRNELSELEGARDWVAHGVWTRIQGELHLVILSGVWQPPGIKLPAGKKSIKRRIIPAAAPVTVDQLKGLADAGADLLPVVADVYRQLSEQQASLQ